MKGFVACALAAALRAARRPLADAAAPRALLRRGGRLHRRAAADRGAGGGAGPAGLLHRRRADVDGGGDRAQGQDGAAGDLRRPGGATPPWRRWRSTPCISAATSWRRSGRGRRRSRTTGARDGDYDVPYTTLHVGPHERRHGAQHRAEPLRGRVRDPQPGGRRPGPAGGGPARRRGADRRGGAGSRRRRRTSASRSRTRYPGLGTAAGRGGGRLRQVADRRERHDQGGVRDRGRAVRRAPGDPDGRLRARDRWRRATGRTSTSPRSSSRAATPCSTRCSTGSRPGSDTRSGRLNRASGAGGEFHSC